MCAKLITLAVYTHLLVASALTLSTNAVMAAEDRLVVVTHPDNQIDITREELYRLYFGKRVTLQSDVKLTPVLNDGDEELLKHFSSQMLKRSSQQLRSYWARQLFTGKGKPPVRVKNAIDLKGLIAGNPQFIGYLWESDVDASVRILLPATE